MPSLDDWKNIAETTLKGRSLESLERRHDDGLTIKPLYTEIDRPAMAHQGRLQAGWQIASLIEPAKDAASLNAAMLEELEGGAGMIMLAQDQDAMLLPDALDGVILEAVRFCLTGGGWQKAATAVIAAGKAAGADPSAAGHILPGCVIKDSDAITAWLNNEGAAFPGIKPVTIAGDQAHLEGHGDIGELAIMLASLAHGMRVMDQAGLTPDQSLARMHLRFSVGADLYGGIAKTRAAQQVFARFAEACGVAPSPLIDDLHGMTSARHLTRLDTDTNMLRNGTALLSMVLGGVGVATSLPHDWLTGSSAEACRLARNSHHIMAAEARLDQVVDPAAGSFFIDRLTHDLASAAWSVFQDIEQQGGIIAAGDHLAEMARDAAARRQDEINQGRESLLGVTRHPHRDTLLAPLARNAAGMPRGGEHRPAAPWEDLYETHHGQYQRILCLDIGASKKAGAAASWIQLAGIDATVTQAEDARTALEMITAARPQHLVLGSDDEDLATLASHAEDDFTVVSADAFDGNKMDALQRILGGAA